MQFTVYLSKIVSETVKIEVDDAEVASEDFDIEDVIEQAFDNKPSGICAQCSGWRQDWSRDDFGELEVDLVEDAEGNVVHEEPQHWARVTTEKA